MGHNDGPAMSRRALLFGAVAGLKKDRAPKKKDPSQGPSRDLQLGLDALEKGDYGTAVNHLRPYVKANSEDTESRALLGYGMYSLGQLVQARVEFERALRDGGPARFCALYLGVILVRTGKRDKAVKAWKQFLNPDQEPMTGAVLDLLVQLLDKDSEITPEMADPIETIVAQKREELLAEA